ncbi:unnamed protein product, partial [marine sediment metagenome]
ALSSYRLDGLHPRFPLYADYTFSWPGSFPVAKDWSHDRGGTFAGLNTARADGSAEWVPAGDDPSENFFAVPAVMWPAGQSRGYWMPISR